MKPSQFSNVTYAISHLPTEAMLPLVLWQRGWGGEIKEMRWVKISAGPLFWQRRGSKAFSGAARSKTELRGGWVWGVLFHFLFQSNILSKVYSGYPEYENYKSSEAFSPKYVYFYRAFIKKKPWKTKTEFIFPLLQLSSELKKINYMLILCHRCEKPHWALMELTLFLNFQLCTRSSISVTPACVSSHQEHLTQPQRGRITSHLELYPSTLTTGHIRLNVTSGQAFRKD